MIDRSRMHLVGWSWKLRFALDASIDECKLSRGLADKCSSFQNSEFGQAVYRREANNGIKFARDFELTEKLINPRSTNREMAGLDREWLVWVNPSSPNFLS